MKNLTEAKTLESDVFVDTIKYTLNGETHYYTRAELRAHIIWLHKSINQNLELPELEDVLESIIDMTIKRAQKYDGDPYGHLKDKPDLYNFAHLIESQGKMLVVPMR